MYQILKRYIWITRKISNGSPLSQADDLGGWDSRQKRDRWRKLSHAVQAKSNY